MRSALQAERSRVPGVRRDFPRWSDGLARPAFERSREVSVSFLVLLLWVTRAGAQEPFCQRIVGLERVRSSQGAYRILLELHPSFIERLWRMGDAIEPPTIFVGDQPVEHFFAFSENTLIGFLAQRPQTGDALWYWQSDAPNFTVEEARANFDAAGSPTLEIGDVQALLDDAEGRRKRITEVMTGSEARTKPSGEEVVIYVVKLRVANCTTENFVEAGPFGRRSEPSVYVGNLSADTTFFTDAEGLVVSEFSDRPVDGEAITLRYPYWELLAPEPFVLMP